MGYHTLRIELGKCTKIIKKNGEQKNTVLDSCRTEKFKKKISYIFSFSFSHLVFHPNLLHFKNPSGRRLGTS
jgi:hypothetical protein